VNAQMQYSLEMLHPDYGVLFLVYPKSKEVLLNTSCNTPPFLGINITTIIELDKFEFVESIISHAYVKNN
jgi:hypothetical protein